MVARHLHRRDAMGRAVCVKAAAIYARVSSDKQKEENIIASQTAALIAFETACASCLRNRSSKTAGNGSPTTIREQTGETGTVYASREGPRVLEVVGIDKARNRRWSTRQEGR